MIRLTAIATTAALLMLPAGAYARPAHTAQAATDLSAAKKKAAKKAIKKEKVEYMRAVPAK